MSQYWPNEAKLNERIDKLEVMLSELREGISYLGGYPAKASKAKEAGSGSAHALKRLWGK